MFYMAKKKKCLATTFWQWLVEATAHKDAAAGLSCCTNNSTELQSETDTSIPAKCLQGFGRVAFTPLHEFVLDSQNYVQPTRPNNLQQDKDFHFAKSKSFKTCDVSVPAASATQLKT